MLNKSQCVIIHKVLNITLDSIFQRKADKFDAFNTTKTEYKNVYDTIQSEKNYISILSIFNF